MAKCGLQTEVWMDIPGMPTHQVSSCGNVRSKTRISAVIDAHRLGTYSRKIKARVLKKSRIPNGYLTVSINNTTKLVHRLVGFSFCQDTYFKGAVINHKDGDKQNNNVENIEWVTPSQNEIHSYKTLGKQVWNKGISYDTKNAVAIRKKNYLERCRYTYKLRRVDGKRVIDIAKEIGITPRSVHKQLKDSKEVEV